jgi:predicted dehydrogenase
MKTGETRRNFVRAGSAAATSFMIMKPQTVRGSQANSALSVGLIGCGNRGLYVTGIFAKNEFAKMTQICDIYDDRLAAGREKYSGAQEFRDYRELLSSDCDAVMIATPAFLHPEHFEAAVAAKKHIFLEKPVGVDAPGCLRVLKAAKKADPTKRISVDLQQRYGKDYNRAWQLVNSGDIGLIKMVRASWIGGGPRVKSGHPPEEEKIRNWFFYRELSGDILVEQDCHNIDVVNWFVGNYPVRVSGYGSRMVRRDVGDIMDNCSLSYQFGSGLVFSYSANQFSRTNINGWNEVGETFICEKGTVFTSRAKVVVYRPDQEPEVANVNYDITEDAVNQFVEGARTGKIENAAIWAARSTLAAVMGAEACYQRKPMYWQDFMKA